MSADQRFAVFVMPQWTEPAGEHTPPRIVMQPAVRLRATILTTARPSPDVSAVLMYPAAVDGDWSHQCLLHFTGSPLDVPMPPNRYEVHIASKYGQADMITAILAAGMKSCDLGPITLP